MDVVDLFGFVFNFGSHSNLMQAADSDRTGLLAQIRTHMWIVGSYSNS